MDSKEPIRNAKIGKRAKGTAGPKKSSPNWQLWQTAFFTPLITVFMGSGKAIDAAHARNAMIFRVAVGVVCVIGTIVVAKLRLEDEARRAEERSEGMTIPDNAISVTYRSTFDNSWPIEMALLNRMPFLWAILGTFGLMVAYLIADQIHRVHPIGAYVTFPLFWAASTILWLRLVIWSTRSQMKLRDSKGERICTTALTPEGVLDVTPEKTTFVSWKQIRHIWDLQGAVVFATATSGGYVPPGAFPMEEDRLEYLRHADQLWRSNGADWNSICDQAHDSHAS